MKPASAYKSKNVDMFIPSSMIAHKDSIPGCAGLNVAPVEPLIRTLLKPLGIKYNKNAGYFVGRDGEDIVICEAIAEEDVRLFVLKPPTKKNGTVTTEHFKAKESK